MVNIDLPAHRQLEAAAANVRQATTLPDYLAARECLLEVIDIVLHEEAVFWGFDLTPAA